MKLLGKVVDNNDPLKAFRVRISIPGYNSEIETENLEWIEQSNTNVKNSTHCPDIGEYLEVTFDGQIVSWNFPDLKDKEFIEFLGNDYLTSLTLSYRNLQMQGHEGVLAVLWTKTNGFQILFRKSQYQIRDDESLFMTDGKKIIHINDNKISLGSETKSAEPGVLGDKNFDALTALNEYIKDVSISVAKYASLLGSTSAPNPYTTHLAAVFTQFATEMQTKHITTNYASTKAKFPLTKSKIISLD